MPTYEYYCPDCEKKFDIYARLSEKEKGLHPECPVCHSKRTIRVFGNITVISSSKGRFNPGNFRGCGPNAGPGCCPSK